jgi:cyclopropane fatty-acyl-phospholipid synthase-like methyltransferase
MERVPEPELMDEPAQAAAYSEADFAQPHQRFADEAAGRFPELRAGHGTLLDVGCGPGDVTVRLARACPGWTVVGVDGAPEMLRLARARIDAEHLGHRVRIERARLPAPTLLTRRFDALASNSLLHHLADPATLWELVVRCVRLNAPVAVMDLRRPSSTATFDRLVAELPEDTPEVLRADFAHSLRAAYIPSEIRTQLRAAGLGHLVVEELTDRHLLVSGRR